MSPFDAAWLGASIRLAAPLVLAATGETVAERAGVINIGLEGMMLSGAFAGYAIGAATGDPWLGMLGALVVGVLVGLLTALVTVVGKADQIVVGVGLNLLALGATTFLFRDLFSESAPKVGPIGRWEVPLLSDLPVVGEAVFHQSPLVYLAFLSVPIMALVVSRTDFGLSVRAAGDSPSALDTAGVRVTGVRVAATCIAGGLAAAGGAFLSVGQLGMFNEDMTSGRGFLALAAVIFGRWRSTTVMVACVLFGMVDALQLRLQSLGVVPRGVWVVIVVGAVVAAALVVRTRRVGTRGSAVSDPRGPAPLIVAVVVCLAAAWAWVAEPEWTAPTQLWLALPYLLTLVALASLQNRDDAPLELGLPYSRDGGR
jgi:simple sugar transport system permease protein